MFNFPPMTGNETPRTVVQAFATALERAPDAPALRSKHHGEWQTLNWRDYHAKIELAAKGFIGLGLEPGKAVSIIGYNCPEWLISNNAAIFAGGVPAGIYTTNSPDQCRYVAEHSESNIAVVENEEQLEKFLQFREDLPQLKAIVMMFGESSAANVYSFEALLEIGDRDNSNALAERIAAQKPDDTATLIYTSGTTGPPKAVMMSHDNLTWTASSVCAGAQAGHEAEGGSAADFGIRVISYLPLSHVAEQIVTIHAGAACAGEVYFAESMEQLGQNLPEVQPNVFIAVPRVWEKIQAKMVAAGKKNSPLKKKIAAWARRKGLAGGYAKQQGRSLPAFYGLANKLVFSKVREKLGFNACYLPVTAAAPIAQDTLEFFLSLGIPIFEVYGMSECTGPATFSRPGLHQTTSAGPALGGTEVKIATDGEVCMRGRHVFKGYFKNEAATAESMDEDGWLHSGDLGKLEEEFLYITGRKKDLLITAGGENIAPRVLEELLAAIPGVGQAVVVGDRRKYLAALLTLDGESVAEVAREIGSVGTDVSSAASCGVFTRHIDGHLKLINSKLARVQTIKRFTVLRTEFSIEGGELTPTMKIKRSVVNDKFSDQIEAMY